MRRQDFDYHLPEQHIAQFPLQDRDQSKLLVLDGQEPPVHRQFYQLIEYLQPADLLVVNDTQVIRARLHGKKVTGGQVELLVERVLDEHSALCQIRASKAPQAGSTIELDQGIGDKVVLKVLDRQAMFYEVGFSEPVVTVLNQLGQLPLPPYIERSPDAADDHRYQTLFAANPGAVAAPTAGLHFSTGLVQQIQARGVQQAAITLHIGAGTFSPLRVDDLSDHQMHSEWFDLPESTAAAVVACKQRGGRVIAVGTTVVRALESAAQKSAPGRLAQWQGETEIFIQPGFEFLVVDALVTNFHLPQSTLLMLVCAFGGFDKVMQAYECAVAEGYRFFSYGDAMFVAPNGL